MDPTIRQALVKDVPSISALVNDYAERGLMLHRARIEIYERLRDYLVAESDQGFVGVGALRVMSSDLAEIYALAVAPEVVGQGLGRRMVEALAEEARRLGIGRVFALTYEKGFFERCGFAVVDRQQALPAKVWSECIRCPKNQACDEIAMVRTLLGVEVVAAPPSGVSDVLIRMPVLSETMRRLDRSASEKN